MSPRPGYGDANRFASRLTIASLACAMLLAALPVTAPAQQRLLTVPKVDLQRYAGKWFEIARLPNEFQEQCTGDVTATYSPRDDGKIDVVNRCRTAKPGKEWEVAEGVGRPMDDTNAKLKVSFLPELVRWLPIGWGDYWILELDPEYRYALVGEPGRQNLWLLSRTPAMPNDQVQDILARAREMEFPVDRMKFTKHATQ
jgi:apolipoprotein D and lipocalin family protein